jgi:hypothetical protein
LNISFQVWTFFDLCSQSYYLILRNGTISWLIVVAYGKIWKVYHCLVLRSQTYLQTLRAKNFLEPGILFAHDIILSRLFILHWSLYYMFVDESCTKSYPSCVDAPQKFLDLLLKIIYSECLCLCLNEKIPCRFYRRNKCWNFYCSLFKLKLGSGKHLRTTNTC